jgi:hypothetical protein
MAAADASPGCAEALSSLGGLPAVVLRLVLVHLEPLDLARAESAAGTGSVGVAARALW